MTVLQEKLRAEKLERVRKHVRGLIDNREFWFKGELVVQGRIVRKFEPQPVMVARGYTTNLRSVMYDGEVFELRLTRV